jgi:rubrerythrin
MKPAVEKINDAAVAVLEQAIGHEKATARFYEGLAVAAPLASLRSAFGALAREEHEHARALEEFRRTA